MSIRQDDLARSVAADMGPDIAAETDKAIQGEATRAFGLTEAMAMGGFITQCAQLAIMIYATVKDRAALAARLANEAPSLPKLDESKRNAIIQRIAEKLAGGTSG
jgi:hypothetical protein